MQISEQVVLTDKVKLGSNAFVYPMPVTLVGTMIGGKANFMTVAWMNRVNAHPPLVAVCIGKSHITTKGIEDNKEFSVNFPTSALVEKTDYCGIFSGRKVDKGKLFEVFHGTLKNAPMIRECSLSLECKLVKEVNLTTNTMFIGEIVESYSDEMYLTDGMPDISKMDPLVLSMPDNNYWTVGKRVAKAWGIGAKYNPVKLG